MYLAHTIEKLATLSECVIKNTGFHQIMKTRISRIHQTRIYVCNKKHDFPLRHKYYNGNSNSTNSFDLKQDVKSDNV